MMFFALWMNESLAHSAFGSSNILAYTACSHSRQRQALNANAGRNAVRRFSFRPQNLKLPSLRVVVPLQFAGTVNSRLPEVVA